MYIENIFTVIKGNYLVNYIKNYLIECFVVVVIMYNEIGWDLS